MTDPNTLRLVRSLTRIENGESWLDTSSNPGLVTELGSAIAKMLPSKEIDVVATWYDIDLVVLAHEIAEQLQVARTSIDDDMGKISVDPPLNTPSRILLLTPLAPKMISVKTAGIYFEGTGHEVVSIIRLDAQTGEVSITAN